MLGIDMIEMVPAGMIQDLVRSHGPDLMRVLAASMRKRYAVGPDERVSFQLIETNMRGKETVVALPLVLDATTLATKRKLPYYDLIELLASAPIAEWVNTAKEVKRTTDKLEPLTKKLTRAREANDTKAVAKLERAIADLIAPLPPQVRRMMGFDDAEVKALPAASTPPPTATETGDNAPGHV